MGGHLLQTFIEKPSELSLSWFFNYGRVGSLRDPSASYSPCKWKSWLLRNLFKIRIILCRQRTGNCYQSGTIWGKTAGNWERTLNSSKVTLSPKFFALRGSGFESLTDEIGFYGIGASYFWTREILQFNGNGFCTSSVCLSWIYVLVLYDPEMGDSRFFGARSSYDGCPIFQVRQDLHGLDQPLIPHWRLAAPVWNKNKW